jgi:transcription-repair coupling factor (superfamily II helicase)
MYCEMLANAVKRLKNEPVKPIPTTVIDLGFASYIPKSYISIDRYRMDIYRKIAVTQTVEDLRQIERELADVYGPVPEEVKSLLELSELRISTSRWDIKSIVVSGQDLVVSFAKEPNDKVSSLFSKISGKFRIIDPKTASLRLSKNYFEPRTLISILRKIFNH